MDLCQSVNIKSKEKLKKFKERMKDRYKINGLKFDYSQKNEKKYFVEEKKKEKDQKKIISEYQEYMLMQDYNKLKHHIFLREQEEREKSKQEFVKQFHVDFNYTTILKIIEDYLSPKNKDDLDPFSYNIKSGKMAIERANRNIKINRINEILKRIILHFMKIKTKLNIKKDKKPPLTITQETIDEIKNKIDRHKKKLYRRNNKLIFKKINSEINNNNIISNSRMSSGNLFSRKSRNNMYISNKSLNSNINNNKVRCNSSSSIIDGNQILKRNSESYFTSNSINYKNPGSGEYNISEEYSSKYKIKRNSFYFNKSKENKIINNIKKMYKFKNRRQSMVSFAPSLSNNNNISRSLSIIIKNQNNNQEKSNLLIEDNSKGIEFNPLIKKKTHFLNTNNKINNKTRLKYRPKSCINIIYNKCLSGDKINKKKYKNNSVDKKSRIKVKNLPLYTTKISDLIKEYNRIRRNTKKLKINYKEMHFSTFEEIDNIVKAKEDMLMFLLKQKYFNCRFPQKTVKTHNSKMNFVNRIKEYVDLTEKRPSIFINFEKNLEL